MECKLRSVHSYACVPHYVRRAIFFIRKQHSTFKKAYKMISLSGIQKENGPK